MARIADESDRRSDVVDIGAVWPLAWLDDEQRCEVCGEQARFTNFNGYHLICSPECEDLRWLGITY